MAGAPAGVEAKLALFAAACLLCVGLYAPALRGPFVSDDIAYIEHPYTDSLSPERLVDLFDPLGPARLYAANYAPVHLLLTAVERQIFAERTLGYHLVNVLLHAANSCLLAALYLATGISRGPALLAALLFAVHPANVEAVAWISQLKTTAAFAFALLAALLCLRRPALAATCFALALLTKASALFVLPLAAGWWSQSRRSSEVHPRAGAGLLVWLALFALYLLPQWLSFEHQGTVDPNGDVALAQRLRSVASVGLRYLVMAFTSYGVSAFQEPEPPASWLDPWCLAALPVGGLLLARVCVALRNGRREAPWWLCAAAGFGPVSQFFPFLNPVADRYLYFILPGLFGALACLWQERRWGRNVGAERAFAAGALALALVFGAQSLRRAELWQSEMKLLLDAAAHYPEGGTAAFLRARSSAQRGDVEGALRDLRRAAESGIDRFQVFARDPGLAPLRGHPPFEAFVDEVAGRWIERGRARGVHTQPERRMLALAHIERGEWAQAEAEFEAALAAGGPLEDLIRDELASLRARSAREDDHRPR